MEEKGLVWKDVRALELSFSFGSLIGRGFDIEGHVLLASAIFSFGITMILIQFSIFRRISSSGSSRRGLKNQSNL